MRLVRSSKSEGRGGGATSHKFRTPAACAADAVACEFFKEAPPAAVVAAAGHMDVAAVSLA